MFWMLILLGYSTVLTFAYVHIRFKGLRELDVGAKNLFSSIEAIESPVDRAKIIGALAELEKARTPWYERSISTIGVAAFFSMTLAAGIQTISAKLEEAQVEKLESKLNDLEKERAAAEKFVADVSQAVVDGTLDVRNLGEVERRLLRYRLDRLETSSEMQHDKIREMFVLALTLRDYELAVLTLEKNPGLLDKTIPEDRLTLAEYYYMVGSYEASKEMQEQLWEQHNRLARSMLKRLLILRAALGFDIEVIINEYGHLLNLRSSEAKERLLKEVKTFKDAIVSSNILR